MTNKESTRVSTLDIKKYIESSIPLENTEEGYSLVFEGEKEVLKYNVEISEYFWEFLDSHSSFSIYPSAILLEVKKVKIYGESLLSLVATHKDTQSVLFKKNLWNKSIEKFKKENKASVKEAEKIAVKEIKDPVLKELSFFIPEKNILKMPKERLKLYSKIKALLLKAGSKYSLNSFIFDDNVEAAEIQNKLIFGEVIDDKKKYQFFETPNKLVDKIMNNLDLKEGESWLEPSAGQGAIADKMSSVSCNGVLVELMPKNVKILKEKNYEPVEVDFLEFSTDMAGHKFDKIGANPPFTKDQDIKHIKHMFEEHLAKGGILSTYASQSWVNGSTKRKIAFREWLNEVNADVEYIKEGEFKDSGTSIPTALITIRKPI